MNRICKLSPNTKQLIGGCCVCLREQGWAENPLVICYGQGCTVVVHKACYGIINITSGSWLCRKCEFEGSDDKTCKLCPSKDGALKRTEHGGWAHVVCALYIPEIKFENDSTMEPIILKKVPLERYNKICCICESKGRGSKAKIGACMNCNKAGCKNNFHVTCGQAEGLLSEKRGFSGRDAYCGYCPLHRHYHLEADSSAETEQSNPAQEMSSSSLTTYSEPLSGATFHGSKKKKRKKHSRKSIKIVGICRDWTYSPQPVIMDSMVNTGASKSPKSEMEPFTNVLTGVGLVPKQVACKSGVSQANFTEPLIRKAGVNSESNRSRKNAPVDDPSEPSAPLEECIASWIEPSRSETPTSPDGYDSESTLSNTSDFGNNIKYNLDYVFSKISTGENELQSEPNVKPKLKPRRNNKTMQIPHAPPSSPNSAVEKQQRNHFSLGEVGPLLASLQIHRQDNLQLEGHVDHLIQRRDDLLDVKASFSIPLTVQAPNGTGTTGSYTDNSVNVFLRELNGMCVLLSPSSSPEMAQSPDGPSRHDLTAGREMSGDRQHQPLTLN